MPRLADRWALVTGAGRGFGRSIALGLARDGANLAVHYNTSREGAEAVADEIRVIGREAFTAQADLTSWDEIRRLADEVFGQVPRLDVLVKLMSTARGADLRSKSRPANVDPGQALANGRTGRGVDSGESRMLLFPCLTSTRQPSARVCRGRGPPSGRR